MTGTLLSRRQMLHAGAIGGVNLALPGLVTARMDPTRRAGGGAAEKSCILVWLCGGPSHLDTWDLKPDAPEGIRGPYKPAATSVPGMRISELHTRMAPLAKHFAVIRSMMHVGNISNHFDAMHHCLTGQAGAPNDAPYIGSVLSHVRPNQKNVASYFWLMNPGRASVFISAYIGTGGFLGLRHAPVFIGDQNNHPAMPTYRGSDELFAPADTPRLEGRQQLLAGLEANTNSGGSIRLKQEWGDLHRRACDLVTGPGGRQVFELHREPDRLRDRYGRHPLGQNLLLARRLVEAGAGCVNVSGWVGPSPDRDGGASGISSWDMHGGHMGMGNAFGTGSYGMSWCLPRLDEALASLITDLHDRGLLERTLVVVVGEFGRSPKIQTQGQPGRVHWPDCFSAILAGGGIAGGAVYGESDKHGAYVKDRPVRPQDLGATIYHALGVSLDTRLGRDGDVPRPITTGEPIKELFG
ncbi:MAG: DUF1501 domain-containing protein [Planctomycetes bacterium]|nr:DUF1501 domain-containing protein [Planctomycetota bacterium]